MSWLSTRSRTLAWLGSSVSVLLLLWLGAGVGIIGADGDRANALYLAVPAAGLLGAAIARGSSAGMAWTLAAMALVTALIGAYAIVAGLGRPWSPALELLGLNGFFVAAFLAAGYLFHRAGATPGS